MQPYLTSLNRFAQYKLQNESEAEDVVQQSSQGLTVTADRFGASSKPGERQSQIVVGDAEARIQRDRPAVLLWIASSSSPSCRWALPRLQ